MIPPSEPFDDATMRLLDLSSGSIGSVMRPVLPRPDLRRRTDQAVATFLAAYAH